MSRVQLALRVPDLDASVALYSKLFGTEPAKLRDGYANFAIAEPPLKLVLPVSLSGESAAPAACGTRGNPNGPQWPLPS